MVRQSTAPFISGLKLVTVPLVLSTDAKRFLVILPFNDVKLPPIKTLLPFAKSAFTVELALGFHGFNAPAPEVEKAARLLRADPFAVLKVPPTYSTPAVSNASVLTVPCPPFD